jgi:hypothetical protein
MKTLCLLFLAMSWAAWMPGTGCAVSSSPTSQPTSPASGHPGDAEHAASPRDGRPQTGGKTSDEQRDHERPSNPNHPPSRTKANRPHLLGNSRQRSLPGNAMHLHPPGANRSVGAAKSGLIRNETVHNVLTVRASSVLRPAALSLNNVRHRGPNPPVVGASPNSHSSNTGAINGTRMNRKY